MRQARLLPALLAFGLAPGLGGCAELLLGFNQDFSAPDAPKAAPGATPTQTYARSGPEMKYASLNGFAGLVYGGRAVRYLRANRSVYLGPMFYGSMPVVGSAFSPVFGYMGFQGGYEGRMGPLLWDTSLLVGATTRMSDCNESALGQQVLVEPSVALGVKLPYLDGWRASLVAGALMLPLHLDQSGWCLGLRLDQKTLTTSVAAAE